jgi:hypothetical protein
VDKRLLADYAAKDVLIGVITQLHMIGGNKSLIEMVTAWRTEIDAFLSAPVGLESEEMRMPGGTFRVERA